MTLSRSISEVEPSGMICFFTLSTAPTGWLKCNGAAVSRTAYSDLFAAIGTLYGSGDGSTTFNVPDLRGEFIRGLDDGRGIDSGRSIGSAQTYMSGLHDHAAFNTLYTGSDRYGNPTYQFVGMSSTTSKSFPNPVADRGTFWNGFGNSGPDAYSAFPSPSTLNIVTTQNLDYYELRPRNLALLPCIKY